ncbi:MAG: SurA N-terminal domain-containing protein [Bacillota bacterium]
MNLTEQSKKLLLTVKSSAIVITALIAMITLPVACDNDTDITQPDEPVENGEAVEQDDLTDNGADGENGEVVATVDGEKIFRAELDQAVEQEMMQYEMQGVDLESEEMAGAIDQLEEQVLENYFITPTLVRQKAEEEGIKVSEEEVEARFQEYAEAFGGEEALLNQMAQAGMTREDIDRDIVNELTVQNYLDQYMEEYLEDNPEERVNEAEIELTSDELKEHYEELRSQYLEIQEMLEKEDSEIPSEQIEMYNQQLVERYGKALEKDDFEAIKPQLEEEIRQQMTEQMKEEKVQRVLTELVTQLREESNIEIDL